MYPYTLGGEVACFEYDEIVGCVAPAWFSATGTKDELYERVMVDYRMYEFKDSWFEFMLYDIEDILSEPCLAIGLLECLPSHWKCRTLVKPVVAYTCMEHDAEIFLDGMVIDDIGSVSHIYHRDYELVDTIKDELCS